MLNRLMFVYFIQKQRFLDNNERYLTDRLAKVQALKGKQKFQTFYNFFLMNLFQEGFGKQEGERKLSPDLVALLGKVPYLNGGLFDVHELELTYKGIAIPDEAFERLFAFFDEWDWHLDTRPLATGKEINPDVLGYIFEKYINQKQMGAYYTKEDITDYISKNTIIPYLFDAVLKSKQDCAADFAPDSTLWRQLKDNPDRYLYDAVRFGVIDQENQIIPLPDDIAKGIDDVSQRAGWNTLATAPFGLTTETWREHVARRQRCLDLRKKLAAGDVHQINDLLTLNLDIKQFAADAIASCDRPEFLRAFYQAISTVTILDPTCGSGAFLFASLNILEPLYEACLDRMTAFVEDFDRADTPARAAKGNAPKKYSDFRKVLDEVARHSSRTYFVFKSIIVHNLYGVDIMEEAVEICKLRLFLKLVAQVQPDPRKPNLGMEPLPDIDFNIRAGNTLVGYATLNAVKSSLKGTFGFEKDEVKRIEEEAEVVDLAFRKFHEMQTNFGMNAAAFAESKQDLRQRLDKLASELDAHLAGDYGVAADKPRLFAAWQKSHQPFHWFAEFFGIMSKGGFNVIVGNPPYVEYSKVRDSYAIRGMSTTACGNLYAFVLERCYSVSRSNGRLGLIVPLSLVCTDRMTSARSFLRNGVVWLPCFDIRPASLFEGIAQRLTILLQHQSSLKKSTQYSGGYRRWSVPERENLFALTQFTATTLDADASPIAKIAQEREASVLRKVSGPVLSSHVSENESPIFIHRICRYFIKAVNFVPYFRDADGIIGKSDDWKPFTFSDSLRDAIACLINSSLFYWFWRGHGDGFHCGYGDVYRMPWGLKLSSAQYNRLSQLAMQLMTSLQENSEQKAIRTKKGEIVYQEFSPKPTKPIIDEIDTAIGEAYGLSDEDLDFIINYDIKYRMGQKEADDGE